MLWGCTIWMATNSVHEELVLSFSKDETKRNRGTKLGVLTLSGFQCFKPDGISNLNKNQLAATGIPDPGAGTDGAMKGQTRRQ